MRVRFEMYQVKLLLKFRIQLSRSYEADFYRFFLNCELFRHVQDILSLELLPPHPCQQM
jgi:hypothetical protein